MNLQPLNATRATANLKTNVTQIQELATLWNSPALRQVFNIFNGAAANANLGSVSGNRMFYANDYMVSPLQCQWYYPPSWLLRFIAGLVTSLL